MKQRLDKHFLLNRAFVGTLLAIAVPIALQNMISFGVAVMDSVMLGSFGAGREFADRIFFGVGAVSASFAWFFSLSYFSRFLSPVFRSERAWRILDCAIGCVMIYIAVKLTVFGMDA